MNAAQPMPVDPVSTATGRVAAARPGRDDARRDTGKADGEAFRTEIMASAERAQSRGEPARRGTSLEGEGAAPAAVADALGRLSPDADTPAAENGQPQDNSLLALIAALDGHARQAEAAGPGLARLEGQHQHPHAHKDPRPGSGLRASEAMDETPPNGRGEAAAGGRLAAAASSESSRLPSLGGAKARTQVEFVSLRTDFEPARSVADPASEAVSGAKATKESAAAAGKTTQPSSAAIVLAASPSYGAVASAGVEAVRAGGASAVDAPAPAPSRPRKGEGTPRQADHALGTIGADAAQRFDEPGSRTVRHGGMWQDDSRIAKGSASPAPVGDGDKVKVKVAGGGGELAAQVATGLSPRLAEIGGLTVRPAALSGQPLPGEAAPETSLGTLSLRAGGAALKTLQIQLHPETLGKLDVTMKLVGGRLAIHLVASEAETALRLNEDAEGLRSLLTASGFAVDDAAISVSLRDVSPQRFLAMPAGQGAPQDGGGQPSGGASSDAGAGAQNHDRNERAGSGPPASTPKEEPGGPQNRTHRSSGPSGAIYL